MSRKGIPGLRLPCGLALLAMLINMECRAVNFNTQFLAGNSNQGDIAEFYNDASLPDDHYDFDVFINEEWKGKYAIVLSDQKLLMNSDDISRLGLKIETKGDAASQVDIRTLIKQSKTRLNASDFSLHMQVPQAYIASAQRGYVAPKYWARGMNGALLSYNANFYHSMDKDDKTNDDSFYTSLNSGLNLWGWQLRDNSNITHSSGEGSHIQNNTRYLVRGISVIKAELLIGDNYTGSELFDSFKFRGLQLATDTRMLPDSQQGFAPVIRGVAQTNALVKVSQNGVVISQNNVPPGPFSIDDILPTGSGGDLTVEINEANGSSSTFIVPFSAVPNMLKSGMHKYSVNLGQARINDVRYQPKFFQGTYQYGFNNTFTGYSGLVASEDYQAALVGSGVNLSIGAVSLDVTQSHYRQQDGKKQQGQSYKLAYSRFFPSSHTNFSLAAYRYSTRGYLSLTDAVQMRDYEREGLAPDSYSRQKNTFNLNLNQTLENGWGSVFVSGTFRNYWGNSGTTKEYQMGYANSWGKVNYTLSASRTQNSRQAEENRYYFTLSIPLSLFGSPAYVTSSVNMTDNHYANSNIGIGGSTGPSGRFNYNLNVADQKEGSSSGSVNLSYKAQPATLSVAYGESSDYRQLGMGASGSLSLTREGLLAANQIGDTFAVINAPGVVGAAVNGDQSVMTNQRGKVLLATLSPYRTNRVMLDSPKDDGAELLGNLQEIVPYAGAIGYLEYKTDPRKSFLVVGQQSNGEPLPFGTSVTDENGNNVGYVGQGSELYIKADRLPRRLNIRLNREGSRSCSILRPHEGRDNNINICVTQ